MAARKILRILTHDAKTEHALCFEVRVDKQHDQSVRSEMEIALMVSSARSNLLLAKHFQRLLSEHAVACQPAGSDRQQ